MTFNPEDKKALSDTRFEKAYEFLEDARVNFEEARLKTAINRSGWLPFPLFSDRFRSLYKIWPVCAFYLGLLSAAFRNHMHWRELIKGDVLIRDFMLPNPDV